MEIFFFFFFFFFTNVILFQVFTMPRKKRGANRKLGSESMEACQERKKQRKENTASDSDSVGCVGDGAGDTTSQSPQHKKTSSDLPPTDTNIPSANSQPPTSSDPSASTSADQRPSAESRDSPRYWQAEDSDFDLLSSGVESDEPEGEEEEGPFYVTVGSSFRDSKSQAETQRKFEYPSVPSDDDVLSIDKGRINRLLNQFKCGDCGQHALLTVKPGSDKDIVIKCKCEDRSSVFVQYNRVDDEETESGKHLGATASSSQNVSSGNGIPATNNCRASGSKKSSSA